MLRKDGSVTFYRVEVLCFPHYGQDGWSQVSQELIESIPHELREHVTDGNRSTLEPFLSYSTRGACWQDTGYVGTYEQALGAQLMNLLARYVPRYRYRLVEVAIQQRCRVLSEVQGTEAK